MSTRAAARVHRALGGEAPVSGVELATVCRFWTKADMSGACWIWTAATNGAKGYGTFRYGGRHQLAHRVSWEMSYGAIPAGMQVCHKCDTPKCVKPSHLFLGTASDNMQDMLRKGRGATGERSGPHRDPGCISRSAKYQANRPRGERVNTAKLTAAQVLEIRSELGRGESQNNLCAKFRVSRSNMQFIAAGATWKHLL